MTEHLVKSEMMFIFKVHFKNTSHLETFVTRLTSIPTVMAKFLKLSNISPILFAKSNLL